MEEIINEEYEIFLEDMDRGITFNRFLMVDDYEDEYSHNEIAEAMNPVLDNGCMKINRGST